MRRPAHAIDAIVAVAALAFVLTGAPRVVEGRELWSNGDRSVTLATGLKSTVVISRFPDEPLLASERDVGESLWRLRLEPEWRLSPAAKLALAYEHRLRTSSAEVSPFASTEALPQEARAPYRIRPLDRAVTATTGFSWRHELDRGYVALHRTRAEITAGRQAIGWGRGVMFGAVDLFSPFAPLEADREWRRGVDALRADVKLTDRSSCDVVGAFGETIDASAFAARVRGYARDADGELILAWRARDRVAGVSSSAPWGGVEMHGEFAYFRLGDPLPDGRRDVVKAIAGGSYRLGIGPGIPVSLEYHYSGFGVAHAADVAGALADLAYLGRVLRGDTQILGRHAVALLTSGEPSPEVSFSGTLLLSPRDGSGVVSPSATLHLGDRATVQATAYLPFGARPRSGALESFYGATPISGLLQISLYD